jgi:hypothetical protein
VVPPLLLPQLRHAIDAGFDHGVSQNSVASSASGSSLSPFAPGPGSASCPPCSCSPSSSRESILESKPLRQGQKTRILGRQSKGCSHLYSRLPAPSQSRSSSRSYSSLSLSVVPVPVSPSVLRSTGTSLPSVSSRHVRGSFLLRRAAYPRARPITSVFRNRQSFCSETVSLSSHGAPIL